MYKRFKTREVNVGDIPLGSDNPIRIQSMTTTDTMNTKATVEQSIRIIKAGSDYVRITAPSIKEAKNLQNIKSELHSLGYKTPLIADIHFTPNAAEIAARIVEKVRINPGNYADKKKFETLEYTDKTYEEELERIRKKFIPLVKICKEYGTAMRIGTNHGSLSDRIMSRFGDTPLGMVESAMEFLRMCESESYYDIVLSMKSSNPQVMIQAYRMLVEKMQAENMNYPLHLGVTEAGDGEDGRIKSALGIGTLLEEGLGDTIRVSLTEEPEYEIPVCHQILERYKFFENDFKGKYEKINLYNPYEYKRRDTYTLGNIGSSNAPIVIINANNNIYPSPEGLKEAGYYYSTTLDKWNIGDMAPDYIYLGSRDINYNLPGTLKKIFDYNFWLEKNKPDNSLPIVCYEHYPAIDDKNFNKFLLVNITTDIDKLIQEIQSDRNLTIVLSSEKNLSYLEMREIYGKLLSKEIKVPVILQRDYDLNPEKFILYSAIDTGGLLVDGFGDGIWLNAKDISIKNINNVSFGILQASRVRISKTEYISCPSCGRTLFDLQETTSKVREKTNHLKGLKIAIMGCIVNGPGEMADADYGYVGSGIGKITLYKGKEIVKRAIDSEVAVDELISLIKSNNDWIEPE